MTKSLKSLFLGLFPSAMTLFKVFAENVFFTLDILMEH